MLNSMNDTIDASVISVVSPEHTVFIGPNSRVILQNAENIEALQTGLSETNEKVQENERNINGIRASVSFTIGKSIGLTLDDEYKLTAYLYNGAGSVISQQTVDFPVESMIVDIDVDEATKSLILTLQNGNSVSVPVGDIVNGLISSTEKGQPNGVATLGADGKVPSDQLPPGQGGEIDYGSNSKHGIVRGAPNLGVGIDNNGNLFLVGASEASIIAKTSTAAAITPKFLDYAVKVGVTTNTETLTDEEKTSACDWLGALKAFDGSQETGDLRYTVYGQQSGVQIQIPYSSTPKEGALAKFSNGNSLKTGLVRNPNDCTNKGYVDNLPDYLALTDDTQEDGIVTEGTKTKWQKWLGINSGAGGGGTKLYRHRYYVLYFSGDTAGGYVEFIAPTNENLCKMETFADGSSGYNINLADLSNKIDMAFKLKRNSAEYLKPLNIQQTYFNNYQFLYYAGSSFTNTSIVGFTGEYEINGL